MPASTRLIAPTQLDKSNRYKILSSPQTHNGAKIVGIVSHGDFTGLERARLDEETEFWEIL
jgi:hypothetical protein